MFKFERMVPNVRLLQEREDSPGGWKIIGDTRIPLDQSDFGRTEVSGIKSTSIKFGPTFLEVNVSFPIHQSMLTDITIDDTDSEMAQLFAFDTEWKVEYGWLGNENATSFGISKLLLLETGLEYDESLRSFMANFKLVPRYSYILADMPLSMIPGAMHKITSALTTIGGKENYDSTLGDPLSLGRVLTEILQDCSEQLKNKQITEGLSKVEESEDRAGEGSSDGLYVAGDLGTQTIGGERVEPKYETYEHFVGEAQKVIPSHRFQNASPDDVPDPSEIRLVMFAGSKSNNNLDAVAREFNSTPMADQTPLYKLTDRANWDMSVLKFINLLLESNEFSLMPMPFNIDKDGQMGWTIIQTDLNNIGEELDEGEWIGIDVIDKQSTLNNQGLQRLIKDFGMKGTKESQLFDLHSGKNVVSSISANIDAGRSTYATALATENLVNNISSGTGINTLDFRNSRFALIARQSHEISLDTIGIPELKVGDNIAIYLGGPLFTGTYKIIELEHKVDDGSFMSSIRCIRLVKSTAGSGDNSEISMSEEVMDDLAEGFGSGPQGRGISSTSGFQGSGTYQNDFPQGYRRENVPLFRPKGK